MKLFLKKLALLMLIGVMQSIFLSQLSAPTFADDTPTPVPTSGNPSPSGTQTAIRNTVKSSTPVTFDITDCHNPIQYKTDPMSEFPESKVYSAPSQQAAEIHWKKRGNRTFTAYGFAVIANGSGTYKHDEGFSEGTYDAEVQCGNASFTFIFAASKDATATSIPLDMDNPDNGAATDIINVGPPPPPPCAEGVGSTASNNDGDRCLKVNTAIGTISTNPSDFVSQIFAVALSLAGGIALILIIYGGYRLLISQGNPEAVKNAREIITSAVVGLLFLIFSLVILEVIGVDILHIPGLSNAG